jgi:hypothetical protein
LVFAPPRIAVRSPSRCRRASRRQLICRPFYESDCQGHTPPSLIAECVFPEQSAPIPDWARPIGVAGVWAQSASASFSSRELPIRPGRMQARRSRGRELRFYQRLGHEAGLTLLRVLRGGLELGKCLGGLHGRANDLLETAPRTLVPDSGAVGEGNAPGRWPRDPGLSALGSSVGSDRSALLSSTAGA